MDNTGFVFPYLSVSSLYKIFKSSYDIDTVHKIKIIENVWPLLTSTFFYVKVSCDCVFVKEMLNVTNTETRIRVLRRIHKSSSEFHFLSTGEPCFLPIFLWSSHWNEVVTVFFKLLFLHWHEDISFKRSFFDPWRMDYFSSDFLFSWKNIWYNTRMHNPSIIGYCNAPFLNVKFTIGIGATPKIWTIH